MIAPWLASLAVASTLALQSSDHQREPGLAMRTFWFDEWVTALPKLVPGQTPNTSKVVPRIEFDDPLDFDFEELVMARLDGWLRIDRPGRHHFRLEADDGARLYIEGHSIAENEGIRDARIVEGSVELAAGERRLRVEYFNNYGHAKLTLEWRPPGAEEFELVPDDRLSCIKGEVRVTSPGKKAIIRPLGRGRPGDLLPLDDVHPAYDLSTIRPEGFEPRVGGLDWLSNGQLLVATWDADGSVYLLEGAQTGDPELTTVQRIAVGLAEPLGLCVVDDEIFVLQKQELTQLIDHDGDMITDEYRCISSGWMVSPNFHEFAFGLVHKDDAFYANLAVAILPGGTSADPQVKDRGHAIRIRRDGTWESVAHGLRTPNGVGFGVGGHIYLTDNQGDWLPVSKLLRLQEGAFYGSRAVLGDRAAELKVTPPVVWLPQGEIGNSPSQPAPLEDGPYMGQMILGEVTHGGLKRVFIEEVDGVAQGAVFRFVQGLEAGINRLTWGPDYALYVGGIGSTGNWGQEGKQGFGLQRLLYNGKSVFEMLALRIFENGLEVEFTEPLEPGLGHDPEDYWVEDWRYEATVDYGGPKLDQRELRVRTATVSEDRRRVFLELDGLVAERVVYLRLLGGVAGEVSGEPWSTEAWYTLNRLPAGRRHAVDGSRAPQPNTLTDEQFNTGWRSLFDGETTASWRNFKGAGCAGWEVVDGCLVRSGPGGDLITTEQYDSFELELDWAIEKGGNSGIFYRVTEDRNYAWETGAEMQVLDTAGHLDGKDPRTSAGANYALHAPVFDATRPLGRFNHVRIKALGPHIEYWLNGHLQCSFEVGSDEWTSLVASSKFASMPDYAMRDRGHIALQDHGDPVRYRNIRIRPLRYRK